MPSSYLLAIDAGTSGVHCVITDTKGHVVSSGYREWTYDSPAEAGALGRELVPDAFWKIICDCVREAIARSGIRSHKIIGVSATSQREGMVLLDRKGVELYAGPNIDLRALTEGLSIDSQFGREVHSITGHAPSFLLAPAKLKWFENNRPDMYGKIATVLTISDWIIYRLSGERVSETCGAAELGLVDISSRRWSDRLCEILALPAGIRPELVRAGTAVGKVAGDAAAQTGLSESTVVAQGAPDTHCGLVALGVRDAGQTGVVLGWSAPVQMVTESPIFDGELRIWTGCHLLPGRWVLESSAGEAGNAYRWLMETAFGKTGFENTDAYDAMDEMALQAPPGCEGVLAFLGPCAMNMKQLNMKLGGFIFPVPLSVTDIGRGHLVRAALENLCFAIKANVSQLEAVSGSSIGEIRIGGGLSRSRALSEIMPAVLGMPVLVSRVTEVSGLGAAICAAAGAGVYSGIEEGMQGISPGFCVFEPEGVASLQYTEQYERWLSAGKWLEKMARAIL